MAEPLAVVPLYICDDYSAHLAINCLTNLHACDSSMEGVVVDDASPFVEGVEAVLKMADNLGYGTIREDRWHGKAWTANRGLEIALAQGLDALVIDSDTRVCDPQWIEHLQDSSADVVGPLLLNPDGTIQAAGVYFSLISKSFGPRYAYAPANFQQAQQELRCIIPGSVMRISHRCLQQHGLFNPGFRGGLEDVDYCLRVMLDGDRTVLVQPKSRLIHYGAVSRKGLSQAQSTKAEAFSSHLFDELYGDVDFSLYTPTMLLDD